MLLADKASYLQAVFCLPDTVSLPLKLAAIVHASSTQSSSFFRYCIKCNKLSGARLGSWTHAKHPVAPSLRWPSACPAMKVLPPLIMIGPPSFSVCTAYKEGRPRPPISWNLMLTKVEKEPLHSWGVNVDLELGWEFKYLCTMQTLKF